ncbi:MAG: hypothetical protein PHU85_18710 [Phycisphaerae bacterium]|nr:hypothetical protein [Phycisphaerae bacterium]
MTSKEAWARFDAILNEAAERCGDASAADRRIKSLLDAEPDVWEQVRDGLARSAYMSQWCARRSSRRKSTLALLNPANPPLSTTAAMTALGAAFKSVMDQRIYGHRIGSLTKDDCLSLAERCDNEASGHARNAVWLRSVAKRVKADSTVEKSLTAQELATIQKSAALVAAE